MCVTSFICVLVSCFNNAESRTEIWPVIIFKPTPGGFGYPHFLGSDSVVVDSLFNVALISFLWMGWSVFFNATISVL